MLETVREYGLERLAAKWRRKRHCASDMHAASCTSSRRADQTETNPRQLQLNRLIDDEIHNLRAALAWSMGHDVQAALAADCVPAALVLSDEARLRKESV